MKETIERLNCLRCNHSWFPESFKLPKVCPKCNSPYWNKLRKNKINPIKEYSIWECKIHGKFKTRQAKAKCPICKSVKVYFIEREVKK